MLTLLLEDSDSEDREEDCDARQGIQTHLSYNSDLSGNVRVARLDSCGQTQQVLWLPADHLIALIASVVRERRRVAIDQSTNAQLLGL